MSRSPSHVQQRADIDGEYSYPLHMSGSAGVLPYEPPRDVVAELRAVVKEVTGYEAPVLPKPRLGFL
jgi:hypothetical protein